MSTLPRFFGIMLVLCCASLATVCSAQIPHVMKMKVKMKRSVDAIEIKKAGKPIHDVSKHVIIVPEIQQVPDELKLNSVCIINNTNSCPIVIRVQLSAATQYTEVIHPLEKSYVSIPKGTASPIVFLFEGAASKSLRFKCALERGSFYQVFMSQAKDKLEVAKVATP